jgi:hypothetical protein
MENNITVNKKFRVKIVGFVVRQDWLDLCVIVVNEGAGRKSNISNLLVEFCALPLCQHKLTSFPKKMGIVHAYENDDLTD